MPPRTCYFEDLPNEVLLRILRFSDTTPSAEPYALTALHLRAHLEEEDHPYELTKTWTPSEPESVEARHRRATLYHSDTSQFLKALQHHFVELWPPENNVKNVNANTNANERTLQLGSYSPTADGTSVFCILRGLPVPMPPPDDVGRLLRLHGGPIVRLVVASGSDYYDRDSQATGYDGIAHQLERHCPMVSTLILTGRPSHPPSARECDLFVQLFAARLDKLVFVSALADSLSGLAACTQLRNLFVRVRTCLSPDNHPPWAALGRTLHQLHYFTADQRGWGDVVDGLAEHCPYLREVELPSSRVVEDIGSARYVEFLRTYRAQLERAYVMGVSAGGMTELREGCPRLRMSYIFHTSRPHELEVVRAIGEQLDYLAVDMSNTNDPQGPRSGEYHDTITHLTKLKQLRILDTYPSAIDYGLLRALIGSIDSKEFERLHLKRLYFTDSITSLLTIVTAKQKLKALHLESSVEIESGDLFHPIATANPGLQYATVAEARGFVIPKKRPEVALDTIESLVDGFSQCGELQELSLSIRTPHLDTPAISEQVRNAHHRARMLCRRVKQGTKCVIILSDHRLPVTAASSSGDWDKLTAL